MFSICLRLFRPVVSAVVFFVAIPSTSSLALEPENPWRVGTAKVDITPTEPVRMAGYGSRDRPSEGVDTPLFVRCLALQSHDPKRPPSLLITVDTIGLPGSLTKDLAERIADKHQTPRQQIVFCSTHTHCGPDLVSELSNIFSSPLSENEVAAGKRYKEKLRQGVLESVDVALRELRPATLAYAVGETGFAANRRVLTDGSWTGFGVQPDGPVDHAVPVLRITDAEGVLQAVVFNYACHCTTLGGEHYRINAEWAGYACQALEAGHPDAVAFSTIGCGADANPKPRSSLDATKLHGRTLAAEVQRVLAAKMRVIDAPLTTRFDYAGLSFQLPTAEELEQRIKSGGPVQTKRHAEQMLEIYRREGRLPATYPVPIQAWQFGDQLTMIFLGGEVVVDYALRLKKTLGDPDLWVTAYANDVLGYIASERMRNEGGYEYDRSGTYYGLPGPWAAGTEDLLIRRVEELLDSGGKSQPLSADDALRSFQLDSDLRIELVASEPLIEDPINIAFGSDGRLWVVEMGDYPTGEKGGQVKVLEDKDGDGIFDHASVFLSALPFPTGVQPWRDGVLISAAPDILFAKDSDGDGRADHVEKLYSGFRLANPQHRISGFTYGLDHSIHCSSGDNLGKISSVVDGTSIDASGHDVKIWPDDGRIAAVSGRTQYIRSRNDWGQWFGNDNSRPMYHFPIDSRYLKRNPAANYSGNTRQLFDPPVAPPVFPMTPASERFNDLFAANRFTSACSAIIFRAPTFGGPDRDTAFICEPVHNLVHRAVLEPDGATFRAERIEREQQSEFLASTDPWFRPTRAITGPDGALWIVDMYRETIEHPQWIPQAWQQQLDLTAGKDRGRIYRVLPADSPAPKWDAIDTASTDELVELLKSPNGTRRDMAHRLLVHRHDSLAFAKLQALAESTDNPHARVHALSILDVSQRLDTETLLAALEDEHPGVLMVAIRLCEPRLPTEPVFLGPLKALAQHTDSSVLLQTALALGESEAPEAGEILATIALNTQLDRWVARAIVTSARPHVTAIAAAVIDQVHSDSGDDVRLTLLSDLVATAAANQIDLVPHLVEALGPSRSDLEAKLRLASITAHAVKAQTERASVREKMKPLYDQAMELIGDAGKPAEQRCNAMSLIGIGIQPAEQERQILLSLLTPATPPLVQHRAIDHLTSSSDTGPANELLDRWPSMSKSVRDHCVSRMLVRQPWSEQLISAMESKKVAVVDLSASAKQQLSQTGSRSMRVRAARVIAATGAADKQLLVRSYLDQFDSDGNIENGAVIFKKHCAACHVPDSQGRAIGASLDNLSDRRDRVLVEAILDPNRAVDPKYQNYIVRTVDDQILSGAIEEEAGSSITLGHADGKRTTINRTEIASMKNSGVSLMPEGLEQTLTPQAIEDLIHYLQQGKRKE